MSGEGSAALVGRLDGLFVYPVKGCRGIALAEAVLEPRGIRHDRRWMITSPQGRFLTQREVPVLATVATALEPDRLRLAFGGRELSLPLDDRGELAQVQVWRDTIGGVRPDRAAEEELSSFLGRPVWLVRFPDGAHRPCDATYAAEAETGFADGFPLLVTGTGSLDELNGAIMERGGEPVPMDRFRPNLVIADIAARAEDMASGLELEGGVRLALVKPCDRCIVTTTDQTTGVREESEPIASLRRIRRDPTTGEVRFGQNAVPLLVDGGARSITVGERVRLVGRSSQQEGTR